ncbi:hypothetical protein [Streptomyces uncialis]
MRKPVHPAPVPGPTAVPGPAPVSGPTAVRRPVVAVPRTPSHHRTEEHQP